MGSIGVYDYTVVQSGRDWVVSVAVGPAHMWFTVPPETVNGRNVESKLTGRCARTVEIVATEDDVKRSAEMLIDNIRQHQSADVEASLFPPLLRRG